MENIKNFDKLKSEYDKDFVKNWSKITTITINDDGRFMIDLIPEPGFSEAKLKKIGDYK